MIIDNIVTEEFRNFDHLLSVINSRPKNRIMKEENTSHKTGNTDWFGTDDYEDAVELLHSGYLSVLDKMKKNVADASRINSEQMRDVHHPVPHSSIVGFIPNVPNYIRGIPQSMITIDRKPMKRKTMEIYYVMNGNSDCEQNWYVDAGIALLSAIDLIEKSGIQTKINLVFKSSVEGHEVSFPSVCIKNYGERFSLQKVSFPLTHPSMQRRFGFHWLETTPDITVRGWDMGYGRSLDAEENEEVFAKLNKPNCGFLSNAWINQNKCDVHAILKKLGVI